MKIFMILAVAVAVSPAFGSGMAQKVYDCQAGAGEDAVALTVTALSTSPPGGPVSKSTIASVSQSWVGGSHESGTVTVTHSTNRGVHVYSNKKAKFEIEVFKTRGTAPVEILAEAEFVDSKTHKDIQMKKRWLTCK